MTSKNESSDEYTLMCEAVRKNDTATAWALLLSNVPVNPHRNLPFTNTPLYWAVKSCKNVEIIKMLINQGANIRTRNRNRKTLLHTAVEANSEDIVELLINKGAHRWDNLHLLIATATNKRNLKLVKFFVEIAVKEKRHINFMNAAHFAAKRKCHDIVKYLLPYCRTDDLTNPCIPTNLLIKHGFIITREDKKNFNFVYAAAEKKRLNIVKKILEFGIDVNEIHKSTGLTLLHVACINEDIKMIQLLINYKANLNIKVLDVSMGVGLSNLKLREPKFLGKTSLFIAVYNFNIKITELLLNNGANIKEESTILNIASQKLNKEMIELLLSYGSDVNAVDTLGETPLYCSIKNVFNLQQYTKERRFLVPFILTNDDANKEIVELLLEKGANPNSNSIDGRVSVLQVAIAEGYFNVVKLLIKYNANIHHSDEHGNSPLHFATKGDATILDLILDCNPNINAVNNKLMTPLHSAAMLGNFISTQCIVLTKLLENNANINDVDENGNTALHLLCMTRNSSEAVEILLKYNADVNTKNRYGLTPLHSIVSYRSPQDLEFLQFKSRPDEFNEYLSCWELLGTMATNGKEIPVEMAKTLLKYNAIVDTIDYEGRHVLTSACVSVYEDVVKLLLDHGVDVNYRDPCGKTPLHFAADVYGAYIMELLVAYGANINAVCNKNRIALFYPLQLFERRINFKQCIYKFQIIKKQMIKLRCAKLKVCADNENIMLLVECDLQKKRIPFYMKVTRMENICNEEIANLKSVKIGYITLYNLLIDDIHSVSKCVKNEEIIQTLKSDDFINKFPTYGKMIKMRFTQATKRCELLEIALKYSHCTIFYAYPETCMDQIFSYLDLKDLETLISTFQEKTTSRTES